ncbi:glycosyltransferase [Ruania zhangjianzhongii]|uniref:glycosyltransferase n=1 Tax=Ruania zhangjianzhongii TaxID=2603206 RepID=UPI001C9E5EE1|nr:glycosyltransferase [Ruania zhangjianzhongii]
MHADHARLAGRDPAALAATLLRTRSVAGREVLAHLASLGRLSSAEIAALPYRGLDARGVRNLLDPQWAAELARVLALQTGDLDEQRAALDLFEALAEAGGLRALGDHSTLYLQLLMRHRRREQLEHLLVSADIPGRQHRGIVADLQNPFLPGGPEVTGPWLAELSSAVLKRSFAPLELLPGNAAPLDRVGAELGVPVTGGPLITVIMAAHNPGAELLTAARSIRDQTWQRWELLVIDDASTAAAPGIWTQVRALDERVRVIHKAVNGGTYRARNTALAQARGELVTYLDSDDWAHPAYLATGAAPLLSSPGVPATRGWGARVSANLEVTRPGYQVVVPAATSLMFRREQVMARIGFYDPVYKAADTEFARRLEAAFGRAITLTTKAALTLMRADPDSLSASDFAAGWRHGSRNEYTQAHRDFHDQIRAGRSAYLDPLAERPFPAPRRWSTRLADAHAPAPRFDVVFAGDWRRHGGPQNSMLAEIAACRADGLRVGIMHLEALRFMTRRNDGLCLPVRELLAAGEVEWIHLDDRASIGTLLLRYPPILQYPPHTLAAVRPERVLIVANQAPCEPDGSDQRYVPADVTANATTLFGVPPTWVPQGPTVRRALERAGGAALADWDNTGLIDTEAWEVRRNRALGRPLVVGRYSRDDAIKFPASAEELLTAYAFAATVRVRMMGATSTVPRLLRQAGRSVRVPGNWELLPHKSQDVREFLAGLDFFVYLDNPRANEAFGRVILEAAASGVLTIVSPKHRDTFGDAVLYAEPDEAVALVDRLVADPAAYAAQVELSRRRVSEQFGYAGFATRMRSLAGESAAASRLPRGPEWAVQVAPDRHLPLPAHDGVAERVMSVAVRTLADGQRAGRLDLVHPRSAPPAEVQAALVAALAELEQQPARPVAESGVQATADTVGS